MNRFWFSARKQALFCAELFYFKISVLVEGAYTVDVSCNGSNVLSAMFNTSNVLIHCSSDFGMFSLM